MPPQLSVVVPVYNEAGAIESVLEEWRTVLEALSVDYEIRAYDDGSRDRTASILETLARADSRLIVTSHPNRGHGPTIMRGYAEARGEWVLQIDGDGELPASDFGRLWRVRDDYDFLVGERHGRASVWHRRVLTLGSRAVVGALFGRVVTDVNSPYRLMRAAWLRSILPLIPENAAVPNIVIAGLAARTRARVYETPVPFQSRRGGVTSLNVRRIARLATRAVRDALVVARRARGLAR